jgi:ubiquinone/menaquinone biosynthesis C-methylase UbiE
MTTSAPLYDSFARIYDLQHQSFTNDVAMYIHLARANVSADKRVLEIGCGTGRLMMPLVAAGFNVVGVDESQGMLNIAQVHLESVVTATKGRYDLIAADARTLALTGEAPFGFVYIPLNTFLHNLTREDQLAMLRTVRAHMAAGSTLSIDLPPNDEIAFQPDDGEFQFEASFIDPQAKTQLSKSVASRIFWATQEQELTYKVEEKRDDKIVDTFTFGFRLRHVFRHEMELLLLNSGFAAPRWLGDYEMNSYVEGSPRMIAITHAM